MLILDRALIMGEARTGLLKDAQTRAPRLVRSAKRSPWLQAMADPHAIVREQESVSVPSLNSAITRWEGKPRSCPPGPIPQLRPQASTCLITPSTPDRGAKVCFCSSCVRKTLCFRVSCPLLKKRMSAAAF